MESRIKISYSIDYGKAQHDPAMHSLMNAFLLHSEETSKIYYEENNVDNAVRASRELSRLAGINDENPLRLAAAAPSPSPIEPADRTNSTPVLEPADYDYDYDYDFDMPADGSDAESVNGKNKT